MIRQTLCLFCCTCLLSGCSALMAPQEPPPISPQDPPKSDQEIKVPHVTPGIQRTEQRLNQIQNTRQKEVQEAQKMLHHDSPQNPQEGSSLANSPTLVIPEEGTTESTEFADSTDANQVTTPPLETPELSTPPSENRTSEATTPPSTAENSSQKTVAKPSSPQVQESGKKVSEVQKKTAKAQAPSKKPAKPFVVQKPKKPQLPPRPNSSASPEQQAQAQKEQTMNNLMQALTEGPPQEKVEAESQGITISQPMTELPNKTLKPSAKAGNTFEELDNFDVEL